MPSGSWKSNKTLHASCPPCPCVFIKFVSVQVLAVSSSKSLCVVTQIHTKLDGASQDHDYCYLTTLPLFSSSHPPLPHPKPHRRLEGASAPSGDQVEGVRDGGGREGQESHDLHPPAGGGVQHSAGFPPPTEARRGLQSGSERPHLDPSHPSL